MVTVSINVTLAEFFGAAKRATGAISMSATITLYFICFSLVFGVRTALEDELNACKTELVLDHFNTLQSSRHPRGLGSAFHMLWGMFKLQRMSNWAVTAGTGIALSTGRQPLTAS